MKRFQLLAPEYLREIFLHPSLICAWQAGQPDAPNSSLMPPAASLPHLSFCWPLPAGLRSHQAYLPHSSYHYSAPVALHLDLGNLDCCTTFDNYFHGLPMIDWGGFSNFDYKC